MGERVRGVETIGGVVAGNEKTSVAVVFTGWTSKECIASLMLELERLAKRCGLKVKNIRVRKKAKRRAKKK